MINGISLEQIELAIQKAPLRMQQRFLHDLPRILKISKFDLSLLKLSQHSFDFWDNPDDQIYDDL